MRTWCSSSPRRPCRRISPVPGCRRWSSRARRRSGWPRWRPPWPTGWTDRGPRRRWPMWHTRSTIIGPAMASSAPWLRVIEPARSRDCGHWPPASLAPESWAARTSKTSRAPCSCTPDRARSGLAWAGSCWPTSRHSPPPSPSWSPISLPRPVFRCSRPSPRAARWSASTASSRCWWVSNWR